LRPYLEEVWDPEEQFVITRCRDTATKLRTQLTKIVRRAGLEPWPKLWQNLRASRETELAETFPLHVVCAWIGNSAAVARKHNLQVTEDHFARAAGGAGALQMALQISGTVPRKAVNVDFQPADESPDVAPGCTEFHQTTGHCTNVPVGATGLEPVTPTL
jgi:hypothetical protein